MHISHKARCGARSDKTPLKFLVLWYFERANKINHENSLLLQTNMCLCLTSRRPIISSVWLTDLKLKDKISKQIWNPTLIGLFQILLHVVKRDCQVGQSSINYFVISTANALIITKYNGQSSFKVQRSFINSNHIAYMVHDVH